MHAAVLSVVLCTGVLWELEECAGPMPQTCYQPRFGCYAGQDRFMHRYPAFHGTYYRTPYNYRRVFDYPWHADPHEPTSQFSYNTGDPTLERGAVEEAGRGSASHDARHGTPPAAEPPMLEVPQREARQPKRQLAAPAPAAPPARRVSATKPRAARPESPPRSRTAIRVEPKTSAATAPVRSTAPAPLIAQAVAKKSRPQVAHVSAEELIAPRAPAVRLVQPRAVQVEAPTWAARETAAPKTAATTAAPQAAPVRRDSTTWQAPAGSDGWKAAR